MIENLSYIDKVELQLNAFENSINLMLDNSSIGQKPRRRDPGYIQIGINPFYWSKKSGKHQLEAKELFDNFKITFDLLKRKANPTSLKMLNENEKWIDELIDQDKAPRSILRAKNDLSNNVKAYKDYLSYLKASETHVLIIPDTNSIIQYPDPKDYSKVVDAKHFQFIILPTVLSELDKLKITHRNEDFRKKVTSVIKRLKGYRRQGDVLKGVTVDKTILVKMIATEPNFEQTLPWLDPNNNDDRIIANVLELQIKNPSDIVLLTTSDINLQNKAELAMVKVYDTDDLE